MGRLLRLKTIGMEAVEIAGDGEGLWDGGELAPAMGAGHFPAEPVDAGGQGQAGGVIGGRGQPDEGLCERIGFVPPRQIPDGERLVHVG